MDGINELEEIKRALHDMMKSHKKSLENSRHVGKFDMIVELINDLNEHRQGTYRKTIDIDDLYSYLDQKAEEIITTVNELNRREQGSFKVIQFPNAIERGDK